MITPIIYKRHEEILTEPTVHRKEKPMNTWMLKERLLFVVTPDELKGHLISRSRYHDEQANLKEQQIPKLRESLELVRDAAKNNPFSTTSNYGKGSGSYQVDPEDTVEQVEKDVREHRIKSHRFDFLSKHLLNEDYQLTISELQQLELVK